MKIEVNFKELMILKGALQISLGTLGELLNKMETDNPALAPHVRQAIGETENLLNRLYEREGVERVETTTRSYL